MKTDITTDYTQPLRGVLTKLIYWLKLLRIKHYIKNLIIFIPCFFSKNINEINILHLIIGFILFSLAASLIYN